MKLERKRALVTGSDRGIGQAIVLRYAEEGADVAINYLEEPERAEETAAQVRKMGRKAAIVQADVSKPESARRLVRDAIAALGGLDVLVNNAGIEKRAPFLEVTEEAYRAVIDVNMSGPFFATQEFARHVVGARRQ